MLEGLVEGWTERIVETLTSDGTAVNLTGMTVALLLYDSRKRLIAFTGTAGIQAAATGKVYFDPASTDLVNASSPYSVRWKVTDGTGKVAFFPDGRSDPGQWIVRKP